MNLKILIIQKKINFWVNPHIWGTKEDAVG